MNGLELQISLVLMSLFILSAVCSVVYYFPFFRHSLFLFVLWLFCLSSVGCTCAVPFRTCGGTRTSPFLIAGGISTSPLQFGGGNLTSSLLFLHSGVSFLTFCSAMLWLTYVFILAMLVFATFMWRGLYRGCVPCYPLSSGF